MDKTLVINAGGQSLRMGQPKALLPVPPNDQPLLQWIVQRLQPLAPTQILVIANDPALPAQVQLPAHTRWLVDAYPDTGPLGGLATALAACTGWAICVACDMPLLNPAIFADCWRLATTTTAPDGTAWDAIVPVVAGYPEPFHSLYHRRCLSAMVARLATGERRVTSFLPDVRVCYVEERALRRLDPTLQSFLNTNTPAEWAQGLAILASLEPSHTD
ncbi:MAG: molybdenum cofactor guanylyltransferase [Caldilineaceae bacterium]|nr:molybdenum cofactor guanylyltransferase [Caldilineaceae bacterium]